jgi:hypothetical protein
VDEGLLRRSKVLDPLGPKPMRRWGQGLRLSRVGRKTHLRGRSGTLSVVILRIETPGTAA